MEKLVISGQGFTLSFLTMPILFPTIVPVAVSKPVPMMIPVLVPIVIPFAIPIIVPSSFQSATAKETPQPVPITVVPDAPAAAVEAAPVPALTLAPEPAAVAEAPTTAPDEATGAPNYPIKIAAVNKVAEIVTLQNVSGEAIDLTGWRLMSVSGDKKHPGIEGTIAPNQSRLFANMGKKVWQNGQRDDGALYGPDGTLISYWNDPA